MNRNLTCLSALTIALLVWSLHGSPVAAQAPEGEAILAPAVAVGTGFTYQGLITNGGVAAEGACDLRFSLFSDASSGAQVGPTVTRSRVSVTDGRFTVSGLDFGTGIFTGDARWMRIEVRCPWGTGDFAALSPLQELTATPYAQSLRPGTTISGTAYQILKVVSNAPTGGVPAGVTGEMLTAKDGVGVYGSHNSTAADAGGAGVWGRTWSPLGSGVEGSGINGAIGIKGNSDTGYAVYGSTGGNASVAGVYGSGKIGVHGESTVANGNGVEGRANNGTAAWGVYGTSSAGIGVRADSTSGIGLSAFGQGVGLNAPAAYAYNGNASGIAVLGKSNSNDTTIVAWNQGAGDTFRALNPAGGVVFRVLNTGEMVTPVVQITGGADLAERFDVEGQDSGEPGTLMVIDERHPGRLRRSDQPYDTKVAGVISGAGGVQPGLTLHQTGMREGKHVVALAGQVYVKADASSGAIQPGDLLTSSSLPGHAMRAADRSRAPGAVIGKAMSALSQGQGLVLVLVNLQ